MRNKACLIWGPVEAVLTSLCAALIVFIGSSARADPVSQSEVSMNEGIELASPLNAAIWPSSTGTKGSIVLDATSA